MKKTFLLVVLGSFLLVVLVLAMVPVSTAYVVHEKGAQWLYNNAPGTIASLNEKGDGVVLRPIEGP